jgi:hypothetical protein
MATQLLIQGSGGGESDGYDKSDESDDDKPPFTKEQRTQINQTIVTAYEESRNLENERIELLKKRSDDGDVDASNELAEKNALNEAVKPLRPKNVQEHINIVNGDLQKIFGSSKTNTGNESGNLIPKEFRLYQNYPNPFNPISKIKYDLPRDMKVTLKVYDLLGRELIKLVDEFKKAGRYDIDFNGINLASGVYFYTIQAGEFVESKKMVLLK